MALPKRKTSKFRRDRRRAANWKLIMPNLTECPRCHQPKLQHAVCLNCGFYKDRQIIKFKEEKKKVKK